MQYTDNELKAMEKADEAFAEVRKVALEFAKQTGTHYHRNVTDWTSGSYFNTDFNDCDKRWNEVHDLYDGWNNEAQECAWAIEDAWNNRIVALRELYDDHICGLAMAETGSDYEYYDRRTDEDLDAHEKLRDEMGRIVESWYECASDCAYNEYLEEVAMIYEYGILSGMEHYDPSDTADTLQGAMDGCAELQRDWDGSEPGEWRFVRGRWVADTDDPNEFWYVREVD